MYLWVGMRGARNVDLLPWAPAATLEIGGPELVPAPPGIVRLAPIHTDATWKVE